MTLDLIVMRLADMQRVHPEQDNTHVCAVCGKQVGIYPSGQAILAANPSVRIICHMCCGSHDTLVLAPGALQEQFESKPARRTRTKP